MIKYLIVQFIGNGRMLGKRVGGGGGEGMNTKKGSCLFKVAIIVLYSSFRTGCGSGVLGRK
jgi:hypothetical protein